MAFGLPVIVHQGDGTEYDLVRDGVTGFHLSGGSVEGFRESLEFLQSNPYECARMGAMSRELIRNKFNTENMVEQIIHAAQYAKKARNGQVGDA